jgi:eukaryotic-like serine/threonine-protein kinase
VKVATLSATQQLLRFGVFEINLATEELRKSEIVVKLPPQPLRLLLLLATRAGETVTRDEIQRKFWGEETDINFERRMNQCIQQIRTALGDHADQPLYIQTVHRHGYRFIAPVESRTIPVPGPRLVESASGERGRVPVSIVSKAGGPEVVSGSVAPRFLADALDAHGKAVGGVADGHESRVRSWRFRLTWIGAALVLVALVSGGLYWRAHKAHTLTEKDTIVLADFDNRTGEAVFDDTLKQGLSVQLEQSPFLDLISDRKVNQTLKLMGRSADDFLTPEVTREVCLRTNSKAMLVGSIAALGSQYVVGLKAVNCNTGDVLAEAQEQAARKEVILKALDRAAITLRTKLGESLSSVQKYAMPLDEATTPSLEALKAYSLGRKARYAKGNTASLPFYERAAMLDPNFAMPYLGLAAAYGNLNEVGRAGENARKAYALRDKVSERERFSIEAIYYTHATGELEKVAQAYELWQQTYPRESVPYTNLAVTYAQLGRWDKTLEEAREAMRLEPNNSTNYVDLGETYASLNRLEEAEATYKEAEERKLEGEFVLVARYQLAFLKGEPVRMDKWAAAAMGKPGAEDLLLASQADTEAWFGKLNNARELTRRAMNSALHNDAKETVATYQAAAALREVESGNRQWALDDARAALKLAPNRDVRSMAALVMARAGDTPEAEKLAAELSKTFPLDTLVQQYWLPTIGAAVALQRKDPNRAVELLRVANAIELGQTTNLPIWLRPVYLRGEAYLRLQDGKAAAAEFQKFIDHYGLVANFSWGALARLGLARAYALDAAKDPAARDKARAAYQDFLTLWKDADPDIPIYQQAKAEYARLR